MIWFLILVILLSTIFDLKSRRIPNWLTYPALFLALHKFDTFYLFVISISLIASLTLSRYVGAGDIKLGAVIAIWSHILGLSQFWLYVSLIIGGAFALIFRKKSLPFAPFMALGVLISNSFSI